MVDGQAGFILKVPVSFKVLLQTDRPIHRTKQYTIHPTCTSTPTRHKSV